MWQNKKQKGTGVHGDKIFLFRWLDHKQVKLTHICDEHLKKQIYMNVAQVLNNAYPSSYLVKREAN